VEKIAANDYGVVITPEIINLAADNLMKRRDTHIDSLLKIMSDPEVRCVIETTITLSTTPFSDVLSKEENKEESKAQIEESYNYMVQYLLDLGLVKKDGITLRPANLIYASVMMRYITQNILEIIPDDVVGKWMDRTKIDMNGLLKDFQKWWPERAERWGNDYKEAEQQVLLSAYLLRVVNGGASITMEYPSGRGFADLVVEYKGNKYVIELKLKDNEINCEKSIAKILGYMDKLSADEGWLLVFDRKSNKSWEEKITWESHATESGKTVHVLGC
jgi:hypothetical protein